MSIVHLLRLVIREGSQKSLVARYGRFVATSKSTCVAATEAEIVKITSFCTKLGMAHLDQLGIKVTFSISRYDALEQI